MTERSKFPFRTSLFSAVGRAYGLLVALDPPAQGNTNACRYYTG